MLETSCLMLASPGFAVPYVWLLHHRWLDHKRPGCSLQYELWPDTGKGQATSSPCLWELVLYTGGRANALAPALTMIKAHWWARHCSHSKQGPVMSHQ